MSVQASLSASVGRRRSGRVSVVGVLVLAFVAALLIGTLTTHGFYTVANIKAVFNSAAIVGIVAVGATAIVLGGQLFSLSIGTTVAISAMWFLYGLRFGLVGAIVLTVAIGALTVGVQGWLVGRLGANPIIVTIGAGALQEGFSTWISGGVSVYPPAHAPDYSFLAEPLLGVPFPVYVFAAVAILGELGLRRTTFGRELVLMGESPKAAFASALPTVRLTTGAFVLAGIAAGIAGILLGAFNQSGTLTTTGTLTYDSIAAVLVGGTAVTGGRGSVLRSAGGALLIAAISDMLLLRDYSTPVQVLVLGVIVGCVVVLNYLNQKGGATR